MPPIYSSPYIPSFLKSALTDTRPYQVTFKDLQGTNIQSDTSFKYSPLSYPLKSTQQLNVDWSKFENHAFFSSAEVKTNIAFDQIINGFPFDGSKAEVESYFEKLTGFENWVFESFPEFSGQLHFSGTQINEDPANGYSPELGTWVQTSDVVGGLFPELSQDNSGMSVLNPPVDSSLSIEMQMFVPNQTNGRQIILQKQSPDGSESFTVHIEPSSTSTTSCQFSIRSGSFNNFVSSNIQKGQFNHILVCLNRESGENSMQFFLDSALVAQSPNFVQFNEFTDRSDLLLGSGSTFFAGSLLSPEQTFSGSLDELRIFHGFRSELQQNLYATKGLYSTDYLKLYYRFNEPPSQFSPNVLDEINSIVIDSSGNSLHGIIRNYSQSLRQDASQDDLNPVKNERKEFKKILFPYHSDVVALNQSILKDAKIYDQQNPNLITKLVPRHYLREGALSEGYTNTEVEGTLGSAGYTGEGIPGQGELGSSQVIVTFLYIWSKFFDEIKMFLDAFRTLKSVDYNTDETIPDNFLQDMIKSYGFYLPQFFGAANISQYSDGEDVVEVGLSNYTLKKVQAYLTRRILVNMPDILRSKGTQHSIKSFLRSIGIDPDNSLRIREFGGPSIRQLGYCRESKTEVVPMADFSTSALSTSPFLLSTRLETESGFPDAVGPFSNGESTFLSDGLMTSGSWTFEATYKFDPQNTVRSSNTQSLVRFLSTGSDASAQNGIILNVVADNEGAVSAYIRPGAGANSPLLSLNLPKVNVFSGERWNISVACKRNDSFDSLFSSSYYLRATVQNAGSVEKNYSDQSYFYELYASEDNVFRKLSSAYNSSGLFFEIGNSSPEPSGIGYLFLNDTLTAPNESRSTTFTGQVSNVKFWSKFIDDTEWNEHARNHSSFGVNDSLTNYNYVTNKDGSFERIRIRSFEKQEEKYSDTLGDITFTDFSENELHIAGTGFTPESKVFKSSIVGYSYLSPYFDEYSTNEKIRIRSFQDELNLKDSPWASLDPAFELPAGETPLDDPRLSIEFSLIDALNRDIIAMFSTLDQLGNAIGSPEVMFSPDYPDLEKLRNIYFNRLSERVNFRSFFEFYRWFDTSIGTFISQLVPRKTKFKGTNFVVESHVLERNKLEYQSSEIYLGDATRSRMRDVLLLQQVSGKISRY